ncbi:uncharacterized protein LOC124637490 [Helicoverpa zea]|uniref:uncharacterized protein LOC124637490 n=1 Tax=Helicoverpa zea TaxID=7113 RepID=UPI001F59EE6B|nr:uncharacterized protein LOC124637490 [Helicoverpa zea]
MCYLVCGGGRSGCHGGCNDWGCSVPNPCLCCSQCLVSLLCKWLCTIIMILGLGFGLVVLYDIIDPDGTLFKFGENRTSHDEIRQRVHDKPQLGKIPIEEELLLPNVTVSTEILKYWRRPPTPVF